MGPHFLSDINEIDLQLAPTEHIFVNLSEAKEIDTSFLKGELSDNQIIYLRFYQQLYSIYSEFSSRLQNQKKGYAGMVFRSVAEQLSKTGVDDPEILNNYKISNDLFLPDFMFHSLLKWRF